MTGRSATAPCGHPGEVVIGNFVACSFNCGAHSAVPTAEPRTQGALRAVRGLPSAGQHTLACNDPTPYTSTRDHTTWCTGCGCRL